MSDKVKNVISAIEKKYGKGHIVSLTDVDKTVKRCPSGSLALDVALGGGYPYGRMIEIYGPESSGKTTICLEGMVQAQKQNPNKMVAYIDSEFAFDPIYAENLGLDMSPEKFIFAQPEYGEQAFDIVEQLLKTGDVCFIVIDSVAALIPKAELEGEFGESKMGLHARLMSQSMKKITGAISKTDCIVYFTNQLRQNIGVLYGDPTVTTGGNALKFYASQRLKIGGVKKEKDGDDIVANQITISIDKNKVAPPFKKANLIIQYGLGIATDQELVNLAVEADVIKKSGSWYSYGDAKIGQGIGMVSEFLNQNPKLSKEIEEKVRELYDIY